MGIFYFIGLRIHPDNYSYSFSGICSDMSLNLGNISISKGNNNEK